jgi:glycosyltransferase 2 family protein
VVGRFVSFMRGYLRHVTVALLAVGLTAWFLRNAALAQVWAEIRRADLGLIGLATLSMFVNHAIRAARWQFLLSPIGPARLINLFKATVIGFAALLLLPARAGEFVRAYVLARREGLNVTATFATIVLERLFDLITVLAFFGVFLILVPPEALAVEPGVLRTVKLGGALAAAAALTTLIVMALLARHPERLATAALSIERIMRGSIAHALANLVRRFAEGLAIIRQPARVIAALVWSIPLWVSIAFGIWAVARAFGIQLPFAGSFLLIATAPPSFSRPRTIGRWERPSCCTPSRSCPRRSSESCS